MGAQVLVTGATGFIGRFLVRHLLSEKFSVRVLSRSESKAYRLFGDSVEITAGDLLEPDRVERAVNGVSIVYHVGGAYLFGSRNRSELFRTNVEGTRNVLAAAWRRRAERVVHVSTASLMQNPHGLADETHFSARPFRWGHYKRSKWLAEKSALEWAARGLPVVITHPSSPVGPEDEKPTPTGRMILDFISGRFPFLSRTGLNFISVSACAEGIHAAAMRGTPRSRYLIGDANLWLSEFIAMLSRHAGLPAPRRFVPWQLIAAAGAAGEIAGYFSKTAGQRICLETAYYARKVQFFNFWRAREELDWTPGETVDAAARKAIDWFNLNALAIGLIQPLPDALIR